MPEVHVKIETEGYNANDETMVTTMDALNAFLTRALSATFTDEDDKTITEAEARELLR